MLHQRPQNTLTPSSSCNRCSYQNSERQVGVGAHVAVGLAGGALLGCNVLRILTPRWKYPALFWGCRAFSGVNVGVERPGSCGAKLPATTPLPLGAILGLVRLQAGSRCAWKCWVPHFQQTCPSHQRRCWVRTLARWEARSLEVTVEIVALCLGQPHHVGLFVFSVCPLCMTYAPWTLGVPLDILCCIGLSSLVVSHGFWAVLPLLACRLRADRRQQIAAVSARF